MKNESRLSIAVPGQRGPLLGLGCFRGHVIRQPFCFQANIIELLYVTLHNGFKGDESPSATKIVCGAAISSKPKDQYLHSQFSLTTLSQNSTACKTHAPCQLITAPLLWKDICAMRSSSNRLADKQTLEEITQRSPGHLSMLPF